MILTRTHPEPKHFYRKIESIFQDLETGLSAGSLVENLVSRFFGEFCRPLNIASAHIYGRRSQEIRLVSMRGNDFPDLAVDLTDLTETQREFPWICPLKGRAVAVLPAGEDEHTLIVFIAGEADPDEEFHSQWSTAFSSFHYAMVQHLRRLELLNTFEQARAIQMSLLPDSCPRFADFDMAALSKPAEMVGGDFFDFQEIGPHTLAIAIADAAGHGLPAALQARDVVIGLRMGLERYGNIPSLIQKLNRVIHRSGLGSRFISLFFGQLEKNGDLTYVNAGHPRPLLLDDFGFQELRIGGMILGPMSDSSYQAGFAYMAPGSALALFSDGVVEQTSPDGNEFGIERLKEWMTDWRSRNSEAAVGDLFDRLQYHNGGDSFGDDLTVVFIQRASTRL